MVAEELLRDAVAVSSVAVHLFSDIHNFLWIFGSKCEEKLGGYNNGGTKVRPPKVSLEKSSSSNPEELEIEIAEVLFGLKTQSQCKDGYV
ncbi:hypothetical protein BUALT_Bualt06G0075600 [Buddleja alternifolia]|uniref:Uncharacterized protein n=1 Tax=Buddleja alternifolia TaxID=168488 RepID=A0AAV6XEY1_9LAMI|nr:hypothetical protein BUALT_Bualt06G0075600 [Buddleja alternifolia]